MTWTWTWDSDWRLLGGPYPEASFEAGVKTSPGAEKQGSWDNPTAARSSLLAFKLELEETHQVHDELAAQDSSGRLVVTGLSCELAAEKPIVVKDAAGAVLHGWAIHEAGYGNRNGIDLTDVDGVEAGDLVKIDYESYTLSPTGQGFYRINTSTLARLDGGDVDGFDRDRCSKVLAENEWRGNCLVCLEPGASHDVSCWVGQEAARLGI